MKNELINATGKVKYTFLNDYMFKKVLQSNPNVLKALIKALLHLTDEDIVSVVIENPIKEGISAEAKKFILDIKVNLNNNTSLNLEMQVINYNDWPERSLQYLCRTFDGLQKGENYNNSKPAIHIGFLDFTLFPEHEEFYGTYMLKNIKDNHIYTDKFIMKYINMTRIDLATDEDKEYSLDKWVRLFKARTWEEIKMIAGQDKEMLEAAEELYISNADQQAIWEAQAREDYILHERKQKNYIKQLKDEIVYSKELGIQIGETREMEKGIKNLINTCKDFTNSTSEAIEQLMKQYGLERNVAEEKIKIYW